MRYGTNFKEQADEINTMLHDISTTAHTSTDCGSYTHVSILLIHTEIQKQYTVCIPRLDGFNSSPIKSKNGRRLNLTSGCTG